MKTIVTTAALLFAAQLPAQGANNPFPLREKFPQLQCISTEELAADRTAIVVDTRNSIEFDVVRIEGSVNLLVGKMKKADLAAVRAPNDPRTLVFYCNGVTCKKSYEAAEKARIWGFDRCKVYDAGVFAWAEANPERTRFFGELLTRENVAQKLIPRAELKAASLAPAEFIARAKAGNVRVYDVRDTDERQAFPIKLPRIAKLSMDEFVAQIQKGGIATENVLILDNVGRQVEWLQYYLRKHGHKSHHFLLGGVEQWRKDGFDGDGNREPAAKPGK